MNIFDLHCDTATELYLRKIPFDNPETHINAHTVKGHQVTQCFAVFFNDTVARPRGMDFFCAVADTVFPQLHRPGLTPLLTVEGAGVLASDPDWISQLAEKGCRMAGLVWNGRNSLATGAMTDDGAKLTPQGRWAVSELIRRGISVDVSHLSSAGTDEILDLTDAPIVASHSNARSVCNHPRNLPDHTAREIFARSGLVGLNLYPDFLSGKEATVDDVLRHAERFLTLGGQRSLALGCDLDGIDRMPLEMKDFSSLELLYDRFCRAFGNGIATDIFYNNAQRFFQHFS